MIKKNIESTREVFNTIAQETKYVQIHVTEYRELLMIKGKYQELKEIYINEKKKPEKANVNFRCIKNDGYTYDQYLEDCKKEKELTDSECSFVESKDKKKHVLQKIIDVANEHEEFKTRMDKFHGKNGGSVNLGSQG